MKCRDCPVSSGECIGERPRNSASCDLASSGDPVFRQAVIGSSRLMGPAPPDPPVHPQVVALEPLARPLPPRKIRHLAQHQKDHVNNCLYRECRTGCQRTVCHAGKGDLWHQVWDWECLDCLDSTKGVADAGTRGSGS